MFNHPAASPDGEPGGMSAPAAVIGPLATEREALALAQIREICEEFSRSPRGGGMDNGCHRLLHDARLAGGIDLGAYDRRIAKWLTTWEPQTLAVMAGWIRHTHAAGKAGVR